MSCPTCGRENRPGRRFCVECGTPLAASCPSCGAPTEADERFCGECGAALRPDATAAGPGAVPAGAADAPTGEGEPAPATTASPTGQAERRLVSVLFADLVGFTSLSEGRDAEETRDLLTRYYDTCRATIARYGGTVEKFIGDAVMAVWGTPTAHEDDAERAVRAALELVADVPALAPDGAQLQARAAVLTGEAAVSIGAEGQGMVAGDLVNTAARLQAAAPAGHVLVGEGTRRATTASIVYEATADQDLRGKTAPVPAWRAVRVVAGRRGSGRSDRLEAPFVGRDDELRLLKELFHATARERRPRLVSIVGLAGIGKSRLAWEFEKYIDGLVESVYWHHGRSPAYGEGITFWALGEMVRGRAGIAETDDPETTAAKLGEMLREYVPDDGDRRWIEPRVRGLLGLQELPTGEREELFAAWRRLFEHISARGPVVMVFGDLHWADAGQIDLIEHILESSRAYPIFVLTLARPEIFDRRPDWGAGQRNFTSLHLDPLPDEHMRRLLAGIAPGLPEPTVKRMVDRAEGIPLYAVETVRMLLDEGILVPDDEVGCRLARDVTTLAVPESLHALIAARLDALPPDDRSLLQHGAVLGQSFTAEALAAISGRPAAELEPQMRGLVRRELLVLDADPRSAERGQYRFLQALVKEVAYSTLARRDRRTRHLAAARYFESLGDEELAGALANHYLAAYRAAGDEPGADALAAQARIALRAAADRATALHSNEQALAFFERAVEITPPGVEQAALRERAAGAAQSAGRFDLGETHLRSALELYQAAGDAHGIANATAWLGVSRLVQSDIEGAVTMLETALAQMADRKETPEYTMVAAELARAYAFQSNYPASLALVEQALVTASRLGMPERVVELLITKAWALVGSGRWVENGAMLRGAIALAERLGLLNSELRARNNLADVVQFDDPQEALEIARIAIERAERVGWRSWSSTLVGEVGFAAIAAGEWDWLRDSIDESYSDELPVMMRADLDGSRAILSAVAGDMDAAEQHAARLRSLLETGASDQDRLGAGLTAAQLSLYTGDLAAARQQALGVLDVGIASGEPDQVLLLVARVALWQRDAVELRRAYEGLDAARPSRLIDASRRLMEAALASHEGRSAEAKQAAREAIDAFRALDATFELALAHMGIVAILGGASDEGRAAAQEAREILSRLGANAVLARLDDLTALPGPWAPASKAGPAARPAESTVRAIPDRQ